MITRSILAGSSSGMDGITLAQFIKIASPYLEKLTIDTPVHIGYEAQKLHER